jgi:hypothetical protein
MYEELFFRIRIQNRYKQSPGAIILKLFFLHRCLLSKISWQLENLKSGGFLIE